MAGTKQNGGFITWPAFLTVLGLILTGLIALNTFVWSQAGREMAQFEKRMDSQFLNISKRLDKIDRNLERRR